MASMDVDQTNNNKNNGNVELLDASMPSVLEKYKTAGIIANRALHKVLTACRPGIKIVELCIIGDTFINEEVLKVYPDIRHAAKGQKGICFPTCVSVNEVCGHNSPFSDDKRCLHLGDMIKVDLGVHIDGFCAVAAHTIVLGDCSGKKADVIAAAWSAAQSAIRLLKPKNKNAQITLAIEKSAKTFSTEPMESVLSHEMRQYVIDADNTIISKESPERKVAEFSFEEHQVFGIDIMMSSGRGKAVDRGERTTIYKRNVEVEYPLKMKTSRELLKCINKQYPTFPFTMRNFESSRSRLGITECVRTDIVQPYPILSEKNGEFVAQFKFTVIISPKATIQISGLPLDMASVHPSKQKQIQDEELNNLLATKFDGVLPTFYEMVKTQKYDALMNEKNDDKKSDKKGKNKKKNVNKKGNKNQSGNKNKNKHNNKQRNKQQNNKKKKAQKQNKGNKNQPKKQQSNNNQSNSMAVDLD